MRVVIVGSGVIGLATAYALATRGAAVTVVADRPLGGGASGNNAGWVVPAESGPMPAPGLVLQALRWMVRPDSPVYVRPIASPSFIRFMVGMARACSARAYAAAFDATAGLARGTLDELDRWAADGIAFESHEAGELRVWIEPRELRKAADDLPRYERAGFRPELLDGAAARALVPALSDAVVGAVRFPGARHVRPRSVLDALARRATELGVTFVDGHVERGLVRGSGEVELEVEGGRGGAADGNRNLRGDALVIAAGAWSGRVAAAFGAALPIRPGKGYSLDYEPPVLDSELPLMLAEAHCVMTPLYGATRLAGTMEFGGFDEAVSATRVRALRRAPSRYLRDWQPDAPATPPTAGLRPMTPDGLPVIGRLAAGRSLYVASGHAMLGLTLAPRTGRLLAEMILDGAEPEVLGPFSPGRFRA
jgi:D-amino-acid dehydrogenase